MPVSGKKEHLVIFQPSGRRGRVEHGKSILEASRELGVGIENICGGKRTCGKCRVVVQEGFFEKFGLSSTMANLTPLSDEEREKLKPEEVKANYRLACSARIRGDVLIFVPEESRSGGQIVRKAAGEVKVRIEPALSKYYVELEKATLEDPTGDLERLLSSLARDHGLKGLSIDFHALRELPDALRRGGWKVTVTLWNKEIIKIEPGLNDRMLGLAVDVGTTTVVGYLTDLRTGKVVAVDSMMNPQVRFGEDVMARITYAMSEDGGLERMHNAIVEGVNRIIANVAGEAQVSPEDILELVMVGNTAMHHIFLGINPEPVGLSPFSPALHHSVDMKARDLGIRACKGANLHVLPIEAGFVGADNMGVVLAVEPHRSEETLLIIDIGTNGEIVLGNKEGLLSTSCATGPAFEGAQIKFGMRAAPGAIERVRIDPETYEVSFKVIGKREWHSNYLDEDVNAKGICGSGIIEAVAEMFKTGVIRRNGTFNTGIETPRLRKGEEGRDEFVIAWEKETSIGRDITVTLDDIRAIQLAKGALYTGCKILMKRMGIEEVDKVILAGAFGSYIDREASMVIGMFPDCELEKVVAVGNAAGDGARIALLSRRKREEANRIARKIRYVELTVDPDFQREFMQAMYFPHMRDPFPHVEHLVRQQG